MGPINKKENQRHPNIKLKPKNYPLGVWCYSQFLVFSLYSAAMEALARNSSLSFSRRYRYELMGLRGKEKMLKSISYRRRRAKQRQVFFKTYRLASMELEHFEDSKSKSPKLKKVVVKVKTIVSSVLMFMRSGSLRSCNSKSAVSATPPVSIWKRS